MSEAPERYSADEDRALAQACRDYLDCGTPADVALFHAQLRRMAGELRDLMAALGRGGNVQVIEDASGYRVKVGE